MAIPALSDILKNGTSAFAAGSGSPGGAPGEVQYNNDGSFAGANNVNIELGTLRLPVPGTEPTVPAAGGIKFYSKDIGGRILPCFKGPSGIETSLQPNIGKTSISVWQPAGNSTGITVTGDVALTAVGTATAANWAATSLFTKLKRLDYLVTAAAASAVAGFRHATAKWTVGNNNSTDKAGGFLFICRWGPATGVATTTSRSFVGMGASTVAPTDVEPSSITNIVGMGWDAADTNVQIMHRGAGAVSKIDLGANFPVPTTDRTKVYELTMFSPSNTTTQTVSYRVEDLTTGAVATGLITTNLPTTTTALAPRGWMSVGGTSSVIGLTLMRLYIETDI